VIQKLEEGREKFGIGLETKVSVLVDRVGSGIKNQDPLLAREIIPVLRELYPELLAGVWIAPVNWFFQLVSNHHYHV